VPVVALAMIPAWQFHGWAWLALALASPVALWGAWSFHRAAVLTARHRAATMDTLVSIGVTAAYAWSLYALIAGTGPTYLDVAAGVTVLVLLGRSLEARAKRHSGAALRALLTLGAKAAAVLRDGQEIRVPVAQLAVGEEFVVRPGEKIATGGIAALTLVGWLAAGRRRGRIHRRGRRPDHRLSVRDGPGHAHRHLDRHRPRRPARDRDLRSRGARIHPFGRHDRPGQDGHPHHRKNDFGRTGRRTATRRS
jgi:hypothetical protein